MEKPVLMKSILFFLAIDMRYMSRAVLVLTFCLISLSGFGLETGGFDKRLSVIDFKLTELADSLALGLGETANFSVVETPIQELLRGVAETHNLNISVDPAVNVKLTNNFTNVPVKDLIMFLCKEYELDIKFVNSIMSFCPFKREEVKSKPYKKKQLGIEYTSGSDLLTLSLLKDSVRLFAEQLTRTTNKNVILAPGAENLLLSGYIKEMPFEQALDKIAYVNGLKMNKTKDGFYILESLYGETTAPVAGKSTNTRNKRSQKRAVTPKTQNSGVFVETKIVGQDTLVTVDVVDALIADVIKEASDQLEKSYVFFTEPEGTTTSHVKDIKYRDLLSYLLQTTNHTFKEEDGVYLIGGRNLEGLRRTQLLKLKYRSVKDIDAFIPKEMSEGVDIKVFNELNGLVLSGGTPQIREITEFIKAIDVPVPNILIEVMVVDVKKGHSVKTGIKAFLSDSVPKTNGQIFPGLNLTLSSNSVNNFLQKIGTNGLVNLGQVTPQFYTTLQALEDNNNIDIRSNSQTINFKWTRSQFGNRRIGLF